MSGKIIFPEGTPKQTTKDKVLNTIKAQPDKLFKHPDLQSAMPELTKGQIAGAVYNLMKAGTITHYNTEKGKGYQTNGHAELNKQMNKKMKVINQVANEILNEEG